MAAKKYRMLKAGEVVLPTDQVYVGSPVNKWECGSLNCGKELPAKYEGWYRRLDTKEAGRTVRRKPPVQQRKGAIIPLCVDRKTCSAFVKGPCGGTSSERQDHFGCYRESDTAPVA